jgi:thioredoxin-dependent peroxiredoxin
MVGDTDLHAATLYDMLPEGAGPTSEGRTAAPDATVRLAFTIGPDNRIKAIPTYR